jgi:hypothetical protein
MEISSETGSFKMKLKSASEEKWKSKKEKALS